MYKGKFKGGNIAMKSSGRKGKKKLAYPKYPNTYINKHTQTHSHILKHI